MEREYSQKYLQLNRDKRIVFEASELPFFRVAPDLSDLGRSPVVEQELQQRYPNLRFEQGCVVDGAVLIQDLPPLSNSYDYETANILFKTARELNKISKVTLQVVDGRTLTYSLLKLLDNPTFRSRDPLFIFPGEGARIMGEYVRNASPSFDLSKSINLSCKRVMRARGKFDIDIDFSALPASLETKTVVIFDDVVASGQTAQTLAQRVKEKYRGVQIIVATWLFLAPTVKENKNSPSAIENVDKTVAAFALKGNYVGRPPINSLSCFLRNGVKYDQVKNDFMEKYITDKDTFQRILEEMRR